MNGQHKGILVMDEIGTIANEFYTIEQFENYIHTLNSKEFNAFFDIGYTIHVVWNDD